MRITLSLIFTLLTSFIYSQEVKSAYEVGLFSSLYLDQQFNESNELINPRQISRNAVASLEFYEGAVLAIDSLNASGKKINLTLFDVQSANGNISKAFEDGVFDRLDMIIAQVSGDDFFQLAIIAQELDIPIINATYPNSKGLKEIPELFIVNPRINTHLEVISKKINGNWKSGNIIWFRRENPAEKQLETLFKSINLETEKNTPPIKTVVLENEFEQSDIQDFLDTLNSNIWILGSFEDAFAIKFLTTLQDINGKSKLNIFGMPNIETLKEIQSAKYRDLPFYYTSAFHAPLESQFIRNMNELFISTMGIRCPPMTLRGYEITYYFCSILAQYGKVKINQTDTPKGFKILTDFDFSPVFLGKNSGQPDFYENRKIQIIRVLNGVALPYF
jgi:hypothetical protein